jgi:transposase, IS5 family
MAERSLGQLSFADGLVAGTGRNETLERLVELIDWSAIARLLSPVHGSRYGAPGYPAVAMFRALLLQQWHGLSDPGLEASLEDRLSFRRFCGFTLDAETPDHVTIHRFRETLRQLGLADRVFEEVNRQIDSYGLILRQGTLVDASLIDAAVKRPKPPAEQPPAEQPPVEQPPTEQTAAPSEVKPAEPSGTTKERAPSKLVKSPLDSDAAWTKKGGRRYFGYKVHVGVDQGSAIIRRQVMTPANVNDTEPADLLICGDEAALYGDQAYTSARRRADLRSRGIKDRMMHRANKHHPLTPRQIQHNTAIGRRRAPVEQVFAKLKRLCGWSRVRYRGLARNAVHLALLCTALNLKRLVVLTTPRPAAP